MRVSPALTIPPLPEPFTNADTISYEMQWKIHRDGFQRDEKMVIFDLKWQKSSKDLWLIGCTNLGEICIWKTPNLVLSDDGNNSMNTSDFADDMSRAPIFRRKISSRILYSIRLHTPFNNTAQTLLVAAGDDGVYIFDWNKQILPFLESGRPNVPNLPITPISRFVPNPSANEGKVEINDVQIQAHHIYGAAGDSFGCYKWDLTKETLVTTYQSPHRGYLHALALTAPCNQRSLLLMGGEDGALSIYDTAHDKLVDAIDLSNSKNTNSNAVRPRTCPKRWISSCETISDDQWWAVAGGSMRGGFLATIHAPTRSVVAELGTNACMQKLASWQHTVISVGNDGMTTHWNPFSLEQTQCVQSSHKSGYAIAISSSDDRIATSGVGSTVDILEEGTQRTFQLTAM